LHSAIDAVVASDAIEMPLDDLRYGIAVLAIERVKAIDGDFHQVAVHLLVGWNDIALREGR